MSVSLREAVSAFGASTKAKLSNVAAIGEPEDQLRAPLETLVVDLAEVCGFPRTAVAAVGEVPLPELKTRPDYSLVVHNALNGFIELKAPGKGADPRRFRERHDKEQWERLQSLPNLVYTDGNSFSLWRNGEIQGAVVRLKGDVETAGSRLAAPPELKGLFTDFFNWVPTPPQDAKQLAEVSARLCRLLRDEVVELAMGSADFAGLANDWRKMLFPEASDFQFADGYAQTVTFGLLIARAHGITLRNGLNNAATKLGQTNSLVGAALKILTDSPSNQEALKTSLGTLVRVFDVVDWKAVSKNDADAWLYFYEDFLQVYDSKLRKQTGSYYTPPAVVETMVRLVDEALQSDFALPEGLASPSVRVVDPAVGTGTFLLGILKRIAAWHERNQGSGTVPEAIDSALQRLVGFEIQLGPYAVAQLRVLAEIDRLVGRPSTTPPRMFVTDTLGNPYEEKEYIPQLYVPLAKSRKDANVVKRDEDITVVIGNPPYKEKAKGRGGWVESGSSNSPIPPPLAAWMPPREWGVGAHAKHLRNLYVYFWRWATWKVFDQNPQANTGIVAFITVAGFLSGPGFEKMRDYLRRTADHIWVIDCSPEGHQPETNTRIFEGVQQPICIVLASRSSRVNQSEPATVLFRSLAQGDREDKFRELEGVALHGCGWTACPSEWRAPFLPESGGAWSTYPALESLFAYNGSGVMPGRTWVIAPDPESLQRRWQSLIEARSDEKETLFHPHLRNDQLGDRHTQKVVPKGLPGYEARPLPLARESGPCSPPVGYAFRSFDRQWIIPDNRVINQPNPVLWGLHSEKQVYLTALTSPAPSSGPAVTFCSQIPDLHHYNGRGGRVFPLWQDSIADVANMSVELIHILSQKIGAKVEAEDLLAYIAAIAAHPGFTSRFRADMVNPGIRVPLTADRALFETAVEIGRTIIWLHTFGERCVDAAGGRPAGPPRIAPAKGPRIPREGAISGMPDTIEYDPVTQRLLVGNGFVENVDARVWKYEVSGKSVLRHWFSYRRENRDRPIIGDRRPPSPLGKIQPDHWLAEYTTELLNVIHVLGRVVELEPDQNELLERVCAGPTLSERELRDAGALNEGPTKKSGTKPTSSPAQASLPV